ncbi:hypothetical protein HOLleu_02884 [Holothuria leucospilota]|uniref:Uncharacterized protein n=1 Tax=Holothuria leucospilota TaxID=206669 RepID=A0A9Q1HK01_HOLLE|nr:hypothetical protein HOLleu_02884 [Holothuria leucospilota]
MPGGRDSTIVKLEFSSGVSVPPPQAFTVLKDNGVEIGEIEMLQALEARNTYDLKFKSDAARVKGVSCLKGVEGLTVTPYDGSVAVTVLYLPFEVDQRLVARVLSQYGTVSEMRWCKYTVDVARSGTKPSRVPTGVVENVCSWGTARQSVPTRYGATSVGRRDMCLVPAPHRTLPMSVPMWGRHPNPRKQAHNIQPRN